MVEHVCDAAAAAGSATLREALAVYGLQTDELTRQFRDHSAQADRTGQVPSAVWENAGGRALNLCLLPAAHGGCPQLEPLAARAALMEHLAHADAGITLALPGPGLTMPAVVALAGAAQQRAFFQHFDTGTPHWAAFAITEPDCGSDATAMRTTATRTARGWVLDGTKCFITNGARAQWIVAFATINPRQGRFGIRAFIVAAGTPGLEVARVERMAGLRASQLAVLSFTGCEVPHDAMLVRGDERSLDDAFSGAQYAWDYFRPLLSSIMTGTCRRVRDGLAAWFEHGGVPADPRCDVAAIQRHLLDIDRRITAAHLLCQHTAWKADRRAATSMDASMTKAYVARVAAGITQEALELAGLEGLASHPALEQCYRDARAYDIMEGTGELQRLMIARAARRGPSLPWDSLATSSVLPPGATAPQHKPEALP